MKPEKENQKLKKLIDEEIDLTIGKSKSYPGYGTMTVQRREFADGIGQRKKYHVVVEEVN